MRDGSVEKASGKHNPTPSNTTTALAGVNVVYCAEEAQARRLLGEMTASGRVAVDLETAPNKTEIDRLAKLLHAKAETAGMLKAKRKLKAPPEELAELVAAGKRLAVEIRYAGTAGLDPHRARIRLLQLYAGGSWALVVDLDYTGYDVLTLLDGVSVIAHNVAFELAFLEKAGVVLGELQCTLQATRLMLGEKATSLAAAAATYLNLDLDKTQQTSDWNALHLSRQQIDYAAIDAVVAWRIAEKILPRFDVQRAAYEIQLGAVPAAMRMEGRGFKLDVSAHALLIADLTRERLVAEQEYREACLAGGHPALAATTPTTPAQKEAMLEVVLTSAELAGWRTDGKVGGALDQTQRTAARRPLPANSDVGEALPHRQDIDLLRADADRAGVAGHRADPRALSGRKHGVGPRQLRRAKSATNSARSSFPRAVRSRARLRLHRRRLQLHGVARRRAQIARRRNDGGLRAGARSPQAHRGAHDRQAA